MRFVRCLASLLHSSPTYFRLTQVYLASSRDGYSVDLSWVYAQRPLELKGATQARALNVVS